MDASHLVTMANQIGQFFAAYPDRAQAVADIAAHLRKFWEPRMRRALLVHLETTGPESGLDPLVEEAVRQLAAAPVG